MANPIDWDKKYQEDLERAQALSLESLALEQFRQNKLLQERNRITPKAPKNVPVNRAASMSETDSERQPNKSRPRPGSSLSSQNNSLLAPPPSSQRRSSGASGCDMPDLISFSSPPSKSKNLLDMCSLQQYNHNISSPVNMPQTTYRPVITPTSNVNTISPLNFAQRPPFYQSYHSQISGQQNSMPQFSNATVQSPYSPGTNNIFMQSDKAVASINSNVLNVPRYPQQTLLSPSINVPMGSPFRGSSPTAQMGLQRNLVSDMASDV